MDEIEALAARTDGDPDVDALRLAIADPTGRLIAERRDNLDYWEKHCFANALGALALNVQRGVRASTTGLLLSLNYLDAALLPADRRDENYAPHSADVEALTAEQLLDDVRALGGTV
ncbi:hypothetical protein [Burkholderia ubonensis]|uniref:hypothetical protein n=1 Tax=Burkholderia ubonensis TaxID=101571 RepID=UPI0012F82FFB|nr:hypothetical protein [Burkholderia ubonensis]